MLDKNKQNDIQYLKEIQQAYTRVFGSEDGKKVLEDLGKRCKVGTTSFNSDSHVMAFNEGTRSVYLSIQTMLNLDISKLEEENASNKG